MQNFTKDLQLVILFMKYRALIAKLLVKNITSEKSCTSVVFWVILTQMRQKIGGFGIMKAKVVFATITGNNEDVADIIVEGFEDHNVEVDKEEISISEVDELSNYDIIVMVPYTYDKGSLPEEGMDFYDDLASADLSGIVYGVAGSGDTYYSDDFGVAVDKFDAELAKTEAIKGAENLKINLSPNAKDVEKLDAFVAALIAQANK